jgi:hypothetical protein
MAKKAQERSRGYLLKRQITTPTMIMHKKLMLIKLSRTVGYGVFGTLSEHEYWNATTVRRRLKMTPVRASS